MSGIEFQGASSLIPANAASVIDDMHFADATLFNHWRFQTTGGGSISAILTPNIQHWSALQLANAGPISTQSINRAIGQWAVPNGFWQFNASVKLPTLSVPGQRYSVQVGLGDLPLSSLQNNGIYFSYSDNQLGGAWACVLAAGGVQNIVTSGRFADTNFISLKAYGTGTANGAIFSINGQIVAGQSLDFPLQSAAMGMFLNISGGAANIVQMDYFGLFYVPTR